MKRKQSGKTLRLSDPFKSFELFFTFLFTFTQDHLALKQRKSWRGVGQIFWFRGPGVMSDRPILQSRSRSILHTFGHIRDGHRVQRTETHLWWNLPWLEFGSEPLSGLSILKIIISVIALQLLNNYNWITRIWLRQDPSRKLKSTRLSNSNMAR